MVSFETNPVVNKRGYFSNDFLKEGRGHISPWSAVFLVIMPPCTQRDFLNGMVSEKYTSPDLLKKETLPFL